MDKTTAENERLKGQLGRTNQEHWRTSGWRRRIGRKERLSTENREEGATG